MRFARVALFLSLFSSAAWAAPLTLEDYLNQVKTGSPEARGLIEALDAAKLRLNEAEVSLSSEFYATYNYVDDRSETTNPSFMGTRTKAINWRSGIRDRTIFGLSTDIYAESSHVTLFDVNTAFVPYDDYYDTTFGLQLRQSLWRNGFGEVTRGEFEMQKSASRIELLRRQFELKNLLIRAENTYWALVSYNEIVKLQEENVDRALKLRNFMNRRAGMRLVDDVDALQAQAAFETRELELMSSMDERAALIRQFNTLRGRATEDVDTLGELPTASMLLKLAKDPSQRMTREDFSIVYEQALINLAQAKGARSQIAPELDLMAGVNSNGLDRRNTPSWQESQALENPSWSVGISFSIPLDYSLLSEMRKSFKAQQRSAKNQLEAARFNEERAWDDVVKQRQEAQRRFEKSVSLEKVQTQLVKRERTRLMNGRSTTFQSLTIEQNLAMAQIQRVRAQLALLQIHNLLKSFEVAP